jgi:methylated-DNA-protein-cysteine methyltransferase-like protein
VERSAPSWVSAIRATILSIPRGKVSTYGDVAEAAGYPGYHRQVAQVLNRSGHGLPWYRVLGAGGQIKTSLDTALDQRARLEMEGVKFRGRRVDLAACAYEFTSSQNRRSPGNHRSVRG